MTIKPTGAYSAKVDTGLVTELGASPLIESILLPLTGFPLGGQCFRGYLRFRDNFARPNQVA
ncbi:MAG: hypothetical protein QOC84_1003 [Bradyrhizobium sp.]|jgi:hypothetical protein|nr:hypothetical protein [Bradyrhizobium sp.]